MQRTYLTLWKQYLAEQETGATGSQDTPPSTPQDTPPSAPAEPSTEKDPHYYEPGEEEPYQGADFSIKFPEFPYGMPFYDVMGKKSTNWRPGKEYAKAAANVMKPRVQTTWFAVYPIGAFNGRYNIFGYHPETGKITDARGGSVMFSPGKNMSDEAVYQWMFDKYDKPNDVLVGTLFRKHTYGG